MRIVGVIDLKAGLAVHATGGRRESYQPVGRAGDVQVAGNAVTLARFYRDVCGLDELYVADLDAIAGGQPQRGIVATLVAAGRDVWLDAGVSSLEDAQAALSTGAKRIVVGLETLPDYGVLERICVGIGAGRIVLSLDLREGRPVCSPDSPIASDSIERIALNAWRSGVRDVIVLDLNRVGGSSGPALGEIGRVRGAVPQMAAYAAGGVRSSADLHALNAAGVAGALVASALHDGRLPPADVQPILTR